jgi:hypothetical protein
LDNRANAAAADIEPAAGRQRARRAFAEAQELRQPGTEFGQRDVLRLGNHGWTKFQRAKIYNEVIYYSKTLGRAIGIRRFAFRSRYPDAPVVW